MFSNIRIRGTVEFERCMPESIPCIRTTTRRMALRDALENSRNIQQMAAEYESELIELLSNLESGRVVHMKQQPVFEWEFDGNPYFSSNWRFEHAAVRHVLASCKFNDGLTLAHAGDFKSSKKEFVAGMELCKNTIDMCIKKWTFHDMPTLQISYEGYWHCFREKFNAYSLLMTAQFALLGGKTGVMELIARKMYGASSVSLLLGDDVVPIHDFAMLTFAYARANSLWEKGEHGKALGMTKWQNVEKPSLECASKLSSWLLDQEKLFETWERENANVYFEQVSDDGLELKEIVAK